jgi:uncharacterized protein YfiM (DUF2279 family)
VGLAAVKYADLSMNRESNYRFSFNKMLGAACFTSTKVLALLVQKHADFSMNRESNYRFSFKMLFTGIFWLY